MPAGSFIPLNINSGFAASSVIPLPPRPAALAIHLPAIASGSAHAFTVQGAVLVGREATSASAFGNLSRATGSLATFTSAGPAIFALTPDIIGAADAIRIVGASFQLAPLSAAVFMKGSYT